MWLAFGSELAVARELTIAVVDADRRPISAATLTTACGCKATIDGETGTWTGSAIPGANGAVPLEAGREVELSVSAVGYVTATVRLRVPRFRRVYVVELDELALPGELDEGYWECGYTLMDYELAYGAEDVPVSAFTPPAPTLPPQSGWDCNKPP